MAPFWNLYFQECKDVEAGIRMVRLVCFDGFKEVFGTFPADHPVKSSRHRFDWAGSPGRFSLAGKAEIMSCSTTKSHIEGK